MAWGFSAIALLAGCDATAPLVARAKLGNISTPSSVSVTLDLRYHSEWTPPRQERAQAAARVLESVLNSPEFSHRLAARRDLQRTEGLSGAEILQLLRSGQSLQGLRAGGTVHRPVTLALSVAPVTLEFANHEGFTDLDTGIIYARKDWLDHQSLCRLAGLLAHEHMHVIGFTHTTYNHPWRGLSVPYAIGEMVIELSAARLGAQCPAPKK